MAQRLVAVAGTGSLADGSQVPFSVHSKNFRDNAQPVLSIDGLAGSEKVYLWKEVGGARWVKVTDTSGGQIQLAPTGGDGETHVLAGPGIFGITKDSTAGAVNVYIDDGM
jgi:hypothetical protein